MSAPVLFWFRQDLRLGDNPALLQAIEYARDHDAPLILAYIMDDDTPGQWRAGGASRWWLHYSLNKLGSDIAARGNQLLLWRGEAEALIHDCVRKHRIGAVFWNRCYEPFAIRRDQRLKSDLRAEGVQVESSNGSMLNEPMHVLKDDGTWYRVFTPFWKRCLQLMDPGPALSAPDHLPRPLDDIVGDYLDDWALLPTKPDWAGGMRAIWTPGEAGAWQRLEYFCQHALKGYHDNRNVPGIRGTSGLSPALHFGEISPRQIWHFVRTHAEREGGHLDHDAEHFLREVGWREFSINLLYHYPDLPVKPLDGKFAGFPWLDDGGLLAAWQKGQTGVPIVDAGMRELWQTGWMHNRVRMIVGSFLVKNLLIPWQAGEAWFWDTLVDADLANNAASWQWIAGCGADAAPYFRVFNPLLQSRKFDPEGTYIRRYVPELSHLDDTTIHCPWEASSVKLQGAGIVLGKHYPHPVVDLAHSRQRALDAWEKMKVSA